MGKNVLDRLYLWRQHYSNTKLDRVKRFLMENENYTIQAGTTSSKDLNRKGYRYLLQNRFFKYFIVGGVATIVDWGAFWIALNLLILNYILSVAISFTLGSITNYIFNKIFTFQDKSKRITSQAATHLLISAVSLMTTMGMMRVLVGNLHFLSMPARIVTSIIMLAVNFFLHKNITFNRRIFK